MTPAILLLAALPPDEFERACRNIKSQMRSGFIVDEELECDELSTALVSSFLFNLTPEGHKYWIKIYHRERKNENTNE